MKKTKLLTTSNITKIAVLSALSYGLMLLEFNIPFIPPFYKVDYSEVPVLIGGFIMGPLASIAIEAIKILFKSLSGTNTAYIGEIASFLIGIGLAIPASLIYQKNKNKKNAVKGLIIGSIVMCLFAVLMNYFVLLPAYSYFYGIKMEDLIGLGASMISLIKNKETFVLFATLPFNIIKSILVSIVTILLYKRISIILKK